jgi:hypothetical protein
MFSNILKSQKIFKFEVKYEITRMKELDGSWGNWFEIGEINTKIKTRITVDLLSNRFDHEITNTDRSSEDYGKTNYYTDIIIAHDADFQYRELGLWVLYLKIKNSETGKIVQKKIGFNSDKKCTMIDDDGEIVQFKDEMTLLN